jgi:hypothetical protein
VWTDENHKTSAMIINDPVEFRTRHLHTTCHRHKNWNHLFSINMSEVFNVTNITFIYNTSPTA